MFRRMDPARHKRLLLALRKRGMTQEGLAGRLHVSRGAARYLIEGGGTGDKHLGKLAEVLEVPLVWLMDGTNPPDWAAGGDETPSPRMPVAEAVELYALRVEKAARTGDVADDKVRQYESLDERVTYSIALRLSFEEHTALALALRGLIDGSAEQLSQRQRAALAAIQNQIGNAYQSPAGKTDVDLERLVALAGQIRDAQEAFEAASGRVNQPARATENGGPAGGAPA